ADSAADELGINRPVMLNFPDNRLDSIPLLDIIQQVEKVVDQILPDILYIHHNGDLNVDHRIAHEAAMTAARPQPGTTIRAIYAFETPSSTEWASDSGKPFHPSRYIDISSHFSKKLAALACYEEEMRPFPHARSIEAISALASLRGTSVGLEKAEAFFTIREIHPG
ncbi:MAG TPA: PIG-L family deacetylase, partial [Rhizobiales bacterium]|nr:PIG-L family deacetylase [Hyphomicrobiales bacterium]